MCLMLYVGTTNDLPLQADADMTVEEVGLLAGPFLTPAIVGCFFVSLRA